MSERADELIDLEKVPSASRAAQHSREREVVYLDRDVEAILIPAGTPLTVPAGSRVTITQELGGEFTVLTSWGCMARIAGRDSDALGREPAAPPAPVGTAHAEFSEDAVWDQLRTIYDPEIPLNIVDLGLIYDVRSGPHPEGDHRVDVRMTLTAPGCGMGAVLVADVERKVAAVPGVREVKVDLVFDPPWDRSRMSEAAQLELGLF